MRDMSESVRKDHDMKMNGTAEYIADMKLSRKMCMVKSYARP